MSPDAPVRPWPWKPTAYQAAVALSGASAVLGLGRELLILERLGLSATNDALQFALSVTYTIALLGEPLRLGALNLLGRRLDARLWAAIASAIVVVAAIMTVLYRAGSDAIPASWLVAAGVGGAANLFLAWVLPRRQQSGPFLAVHAVTVMPNIFMVAALLLPAASDQAFAARVVALFLVMPLVQLGALAVLHRFGTPAALEQAPSTAEGLRPVALHAVGAAGGQITQLVMRSALLAAPAGSLTAFNLVLRATDTIRAIFVDTYIASRVRKWAAGERGTSALVDGRWLPASGLAAVALGALFLAMLWQGPSERLLSPVTAMLVIGGYLTLALRVRYQLLNTSAQPLGLVRRIAGLEVVGAIGVGVLSVLPWAPLALLPWVAYVARPAAGLWLVSSRSDLPPELPPED